MTTTRIPEIASINLSARIAILDDGSEARITVLIDAEGDETSDACAAVGLVVGPVLGMWLAGTIAAFPNATVH